MSPAPCGLIPPTTLTTTISRWDRLCIWMGSLPASILGYLQKGFDATNRTVETRLVMFTLGGLLIMVLIAWDYSITHKLNNTALATLATLISVGNLSMMHRGDQ